MSVEDEEMLEHQRWEAQAEIAWYKEQTTPREVSPADDVLLTRLAIILPAGSRARWVEEWRAELAELPVGERRKFLREIAAGLLPMAATLRRPARRRLQ